MIARYTSTLPIRGEILNPECGGSHFGPPTPAGENTIILHWLGGKHSRTESGAGGNRISLEMISLQKNITQHFKLNSPQMTPYFCGKMTGEHTFCRKASSKQVGTLTNTRHRTANFTNCALSVK